jgi:hypothetical protein
VAHVLEEFADEHPAQQYIEPRPPGVTVAVLERLPVQPENHEVDDQGWEGNGGQVHRVRAVRLASVCGLELLDCKPPKWATSLRAGKRIKSGLRPLESRKSCF